MASLIATLLPHRLAEDRDEAVKGLVAALRSEGAVPEDLARLLADMLDPNGKTAWRLDVCQRGKRGPAPRPLSPKMRSAGEHAYEAIEERGAKYDQAVKDAADQFGVSPSSVKTALRKVREEQAILDEVEQQTGERPFRLFSS